MHVHHAQPDGLGGISLITERSTRMVRSSHEADVISLLRLFYVKTFETGSERSHMKEALVIIFIYRLRWLY